MASSRRPVILFMFAGRRGNMEVNLPLIRRILDEHPRVEFHLWNLARTTADSNYLCTIEGERIKVINKFAGRRARLSLNKVWWYYADPRFSEALFVKVDDDILFIQTEHFGAFLDAVEDNPERILSAEVINNGACTEYIPELWDGFAELGIPLLDVHESSEYAQLAHRHMIDRWCDLVARPVDVVSTEEWLSINFIGLNWELLDLIGRRIGRRSPPEIAGRAWRSGSRVGDEGAANMFPRAVMRGFTVGHLGFGPQKLTPEQEDEWRASYAAIGREYLGGVRKPNALGSLHA